MSKTHSFASALAPSTFAAAIVAAIFFFASAGFAHAALYNASGILGQSDQNGHPSYTQDTLNNGDAVNPDNEAVDTINH
jgi:hypothetical protein